MTPHPIHGAPRVLIVEDDAVLRRHFERAIDANPNLSLLGSVGSHRQAELLLNHRPDVMLVDLGLPDGDGIDLIRQLKAIHPAAESLVVSVFAEEDKVVAAIRAGASGYLLKDMLSQDIGETILEVLGGASPISPSIARYILKALSSPATTDDSQEGGSKAILSPREVDVLNLIARGCSRKEIGIKLGISLHTVVSHTRHIYEKLEVGSRGAAVFEGYERGIIQRNPSAN
ncbi:MAG: DNA-binding response regulator [Alphaproteobacteria bacterium CG_4_10_14_0_2_um_filter_63_37]|nr:MAG: DNA-binding response regulator [Alphaproteobacteria bacterium CG_4_10_14_0_2_um_filter_63_37]